MTIATGQTITAADLNSLYTNSLTKLRNFNRIDEFADYYEFTFNNVAAPSTINDIKQSVQFTPPIDLNLNNITLIATTVSIADSFTMTFTGSTLLNPITLSATTSGVTGSLVVSGNFFSSVATNSILNTLFAGATYNIAIRGGGLSTTNFVGVSLAVTNGFRR